MVDKLGPVDEEERIHVSDNVVLGHPGSGKKDSLRKGERKDLSPVYIGDDVLIRDYVVIYEGVSLGNGVEVGHHVLLREHCTVGENTVIGSGSIIEDECKIGKNVSIQSGVYLPSGTVVEDGVFLGPRICVTNDKYMDSEIEPVVIREGAKVGANSTLMAGIDVGRNAVIGAGSVVTKDVDEGEKVYGVPAKKQD